MAGEGPFVVVLLLAIVSPFVRWAVIDRETDRTEVMDRQRAERSARSDTHEGNTGRGRDAGGWDE